MKAITFSINKKLCGNMSFVFGLLVAKIVFSFLLLSVDRTYLRREMRNTI